MVNTLILNKKRNVHIERERRIEIARKIDSPVKLHGEQCTRKLKGILMISKGKTITLLNNYFSMFVFAS